MVIKDFNDLNTINFMPEDIVVYNGFPTPPATHICGSSDKMFSRFFYIVSGGIEFNKGEKDYIRAEAGSILFLPNNITYRSQWYTQAPCEYITFNCRLLISGGEELLLSDKILLMTKDKSGDYYKIFKKMHEVYRSGGKFAHFRLKALLLQFLGEILYDTEKYNLKSQDSTGIIYKGILYIEKHYNEDIEVKKLAELCNVSESTFQRKFRKYKGISPIQYRNQLRLLKAKEMLESGIYRVGEVAELMNFNDIAYFSKVFKNAFGVNPSDFMKH